jgi:putative pyoverdin transport system ATP-binding/permease protein
MTLLRFLFRLSPRLVLLAVLFGVISGAGSAGLLALISAALTQRELSPRLPLAFLGLCLLALVARFGSDFILSYLGHGSSLKLRMKLSQQILAAPLRHVEQLGPARLYATLTEDISVIINALTNLPLLCINFAVVLGCVVYLIWLSPLLSLIVLGFILFGGLTYQIPILRGTHWQKLAREGVDELFTHFRGLTEGIKELKLHGRRRKAFLFEALFPVAESLRRNHNRSMTYFIAAGSWGQTLFFVFMGMLLFVLPFSRQLDGNVLIACTVTVLYIVHPLDSLMNSVSYMSRANVALNKVETLGLSLAAETESSAVELTEKKYEWDFLELMGVTHSYHREQENSSFILGPIDLTFIPGELVFVIGGNGSGKTTLLKVLSGLYTPEDGEIQFNGIPVTAETIEHYRQYFSVVFSDFYLFDSLLGIEEKNLDARAHEYLRLLHLDHKVKIRNGVLSTTELSQGQRKRLALLVAYLEDRPINIFDEWAADQDPQFKEVFYHQLLPDLKARGKTVIIISHDDRYYHEADRIIKLENGNLEYDKQLIITQHTPTSLVAGF